MKIGIIGMPQSGKKTFFRLLTGVDNPAMNFGICKIKDPRVEALVKTYQPKKTVYGEIEFTVFPSIEPGSESFKPLLENIKKMDALCLVARAFTNESVFHISTTVDAVRDIRTVLSEILLNDLSLAETRLTRIAQEQKRNFAEDRVKEEKVLLKIKESFESEKFLNSVSLNPDEKKAVSSLSFVSSSNLLIVVNVDDSDVKDDAKKKKFTDSLPGFSERLLFISAKIEEEISQLSPEDKTAFLADLGVSEPAINYMTRKSAELLDLVTFFTVGKDEVRAWMIRKNSTAVEAAQKIHSDIAKGFIRAEVFKYKDLEKFGTEDKIKAEGLFGLKGKEYIVEDGDIINFRFNV